MNSVREPIAREVYAGHGHDRAMGYKFRCRIESVTYREWFGLGRHVTKYRYVLEKYFMSWSDEDWGPWCSLASANAQALKRLNRIEWSPSDEPKEKCFYVK